MNSLKMLGIILIIALVFVIISPKASYLEIEQRNMLIGALAFFGVLFLVMGSMGVGESKEETEKEQKIKISKEINDQQKSEMPESSNNDEKSHPIVEQNEGNMAESSNKEGRVPPAMPPLPNEKRIGRRKPSK